MLSRPSPLISVIVLNYNGARWLKKCLGSLRTQSMFDRLEILVADNCSPDQSDRLAAEIMSGWNNGRVIQNGSNLGFCEGNNRAAVQATGKYLFFLNNDTWMESDCLEKLLQAVEAMGAQAGQPLIVDYEDASVVNPSGAGFDIFGLLSGGEPGTDAHEVFVVGGCSYLIERELFHALGGFDPVFFMYVDEFDLSWRLWISGARAIIAPCARLHHRGAADVNPEGGGRIVAVRTSDTKRYYANRNGLLLILKNAEGVLLLLLPFQLLLLGMEACVGLLLVRRWSFIRRAYLDAVADCWKLRRHVLAERKRIAGFRRHSDWKLLRFLRGPLNRWQEFRNFRRHGLPTVVDK